MPSYSSRSRCRICAVVALVTLPVAACTKTESAQAHGREAAAKTVKVEVVREETVRRAVEVVGTLAAVDQVTISSEADGKVSRILADLGDRVTAGQALIQVDREKQQYNFDQQKATLERALAQLGAADPRQLRDTEIRAPFDGYVEKRLVNLGELVKNQMPVMSVVRVDPLKVIAEIPEKMAPWIKDGQGVQLHVDAYPDQTFIGKVSRISPAVNTATRAFPVEALVPNKDALLKPGTFARVLIESGKVDNVLTLPFAALQYRYGVNRVFVVAGDKLAARELKVGDRLGDRIEILDGIRAGDQVAATDVDKLADGMKVTTGRTE